MAKLTKPARDRISATKFAFPKQRKEPLENASHVRNAVARFDQVKGVTEAERENTLAPEFCRHQTLATVSHGFVWLDRRLYRPALLAAA
jgi:hypothetical protein